MATDRIAPFSGGEKTRLALAMVVWQRPNLLVMDEPTNHLDMEMRLALTVALQGYEGALVLVTHDRHLLRNTVDELLLVHDGTVEEYEEDVSAYERWVLQQQKQDRQEDAAGGNEGNLTRKEQRQAAARQRQQAIHDAGERLAALESRLADSALYAEERKQELDDLLKDEGRLRQQSEELEETWLNLQQELEQLEGSLSQGP